MAALLGSLISLCIGSSYAKTLFPDLGVEGVSALRIGLSALILWAAIRPWRTVWQWRDMPPLALYGLTLGFMNLLFYQAIARIPLGLAIAIEFTGPLAVAIWYSHRRIDALWVALAVIGLALLLPWAGVPESALDPWGVAYAMAAAVCWALYIVQGQRVARRYGVNAVALGMAFGALGVVPIGVWHAGAELLQPTWLWFGVWVALFSSALPYALEIFSLRHLPRHTFSICLSLEPVVGAVAGWVLLAEHLSLTQWLAIALVMAASMGSAWPRRATEAV
ncbi:MAG: DMT family transporter [Alphaproteobacteria bacterium]|nr:DMT family transporter [Alphaproteobacteria bacterium]